MANKVERRRDGRRDRDWVIRAWRTGAFARTLAGSAPEAKLAQYEHYVQELTRDGLLPEAGS
ncbi:unnamed protein product [Ectocarpus sp. 8 AP-2014]